MLNQLGVAKCSSPTAVRPGAGAGWLDTPWTPSPRPADVLRRYREA